MKQWPRVRLGEIAPICRRPVIVDLSASYPELGIRSFGRGTFHKPPLAGSDVGGKKLYEIVPGDLVFSNVFAWEGAVAVARDEDAGRFGSHRFIACTVDPARADPKFICSYLVASHDGLEQLRRASPGGAGRNRTLGLEKLVGIEVPLPPLAEQQAIVARLDALANKTRLLAAHLDAIESDADLMLATLATRADLSNEERRARGWKEGCLSDVLKLVSDPIKVDTGAKYPNVGVLSFARGLFTKPPIDGAATSATTLYRLHAGQFVYSRLFAFEGAYAVVGAEHDGYCVSNEFPAFAIDLERASPEFLLAYFRSPSIWEEIARDSKGLGDRRQRVQPERVLNHRLWLPPRPQLEMLANAVPRILALKTRHAALREANAAVLPATLERLFA